MSTPIISLQVVIGNQVGGRAAHTGRSYDKDSFDPLGNKRYKLGYLGQAGCEHVSHANLHDNFTVHETKVPKGQNAAVQTLASTLLLSCGSVRAHPNLSGQSMCLTIARHGVTKRRCLRYTQSNDGDTFPLDPDEISAALNRFISSGDCSTGVTNSAKRTIHDCPNRACASPAPSGSAGRGTHRRTSASPNSAGSP